jgi:hypothetical protein
LKKLAAAVLLAAAAAAAALAAVPLHAPRELLPPRVLSAARARGPLFAGGASVAIEVVPGTPVGGYPRVRWASQGVRDAPMVRALVLSTPGFAAAVASADVLLVPPELRRRVESRLADLRLDALLLAATHTHAGPGGHWRDALGERVGTGPFDERALDRLAAAAERAVREALAARVPARLAAARAQLPALVRNRDGNAPDARLLVLRALAADGRALGQVVVFPAHATVLGSDNRLLSGDWPGALARELPGTTVFLQGAVGDQSVSLWGGVPDPETYARALAAEVGRLPFPPGDPEPPLGAGLAEVSLPAPSFAAVPRFLDRLLQNLLWTWLPDRTDVLALRAGPALLLAVPAEPAEEVARRWREAMGEGAEVVSLARDYVGYVETPERVRARAGEARRTYLGPELARVLGDGLAAAARAQGQAPLPRAAGGG